MKDPADMSEAEHNHYEQLVEEMENISGALTISRVTSNIEDDYITVEFRYPDRERVRAKVGLRSFAQALTGRSEVPCSFRVKKRKV